MSTEKLKTQTELMTLKEVADCNTFYLGCGIIDKHTPNCPEIFSQFFTNGGYGILFAYKNITHLNSTGYPNAITQVFIGIDADNEGSIIYAARDILPDGSGGLWMQTTTALNILSNQYKYNLESIIDCNKFLTGIGIANSRTLNIPQYETDLSAILIESFKVSETPNVYMQRATTIDEEYGTRFGVATVHIRYINTSTGSYGKWHPINGTPIE